ncbi:MAG: RagB/SusD family nutrient uptake outer membrane protein [Bacteroidales bacterium]|nr:RagB/SusD family nutrient uptake outer membrane protein [Bacteroidales bacterium]
MMKRIIKYGIISMFCSALAVSCNYLDIVPDQIPTIDDAFADRYTAEQYLATCYWGMPKAAGWDQNPAFLGSMEMIMNSNFRTSGGMIFALGEDNPTSSAINYWGGTGTAIRSLYAGIRECNIFLDNIRKVQDLKSDETERMIAEVNLLKAWMHFYLITHYGPVCIVRESAPVNESTQGIRVYRDKIDDCFAYVIELLDGIIAGNALPDRITNRTTELGRFTQAVPYALKARVLTYWASDLFNGNTDYATFKNHEGEPFFNQVKDPARWTRAAEACRKAVEVCLNNGIRLYQKADYLQTKPMSDTTLLVNTLRSAVSEQINMNVELVYGNTGYPCAANVQRHCLPRFETGSAANATSRLNVPLHIADLFYSNHGVPLNEDEEWAMQDRYSSRFETLRAGDEAHRFFLQPAEITSALHFDREVRFYAALGFDRGKWYGNHYNNEPNDDAECFYVQTRFAEVANRVSNSEYNSTGYWAKKLVALNSRWRDANELTYMPYPYPDIRFADLLLLASETVNEATPGEDNAAVDPEVYTYIDLVRARAGLEGVVKSWNDHAIAERKGRPLTKGGMRDIIRHERKIELALEGQDYWDRKRWKVAHRELNRNIQGWNTLVEDVSPQAYYTPTTVYTQRFTVRDYFAPIPESDLINNPQLVQNPGW